MPYTDHFFCMIMDPVFRYNPRHSVRALSDPVDPEQAQGIEKAPAGCEKNEGVFLLTSFWSVAFGGYGDDANLSAG
jgi:hypothetical protein